MEEDIKILEKINITTYGTKEELEALGKELSEIDINKIIKNLINKYKELEKERDDIYADYQDLGKEKLKLEEECEKQEKIIELMAKELSRKKGMIKKVCGNFNCEECIEIKFEECVIEFFRKKAKGE